MSKAKQFIKDYTKTCSNELCAVEDRYGKKVISYHEWLTPEQALSAMAIEREEVIEEVCEWLEEHSHKYMKYHVGLEYTVYVYDKGELVDDLKKAMEKQV